MGSEVHPALAALTAELTARSSRSRALYLERIAAARAAGPARDAAGCSNLAHGLAACDADERAVLVGDRGPGIAIVTSYNDMLSAHQPFATYPAALRRAVMKAGGVAQVAGGVPAMCDGITQGRAGMELSLFSRDVVAMATAIALAHDTFDGALLLGVCDKIVPGLLIGALSFGHLPTVLVPAGPMPSGLGNAEKSRVRQLHAEGKAGREDLLAAESAAYHSPGTCTFYGTANSNQLLVEAMGLQLPGAGFVNPGTDLRVALTAAAGRRVVEITSFGEGYAPIGEIVNERAVLNAVVALLATGGSTNHTMHLVAIAAAAGIDLRWEDFAELSRHVPLLARIYPNGSADVNHFQAAGGTAFLFDQLLGAGLMHGDVMTVAGPGLKRYTRRPELGADGVLAERPVAKETGEREVLRGVAEAFAPEGGLRLLRGNLGRAVVKVSALAPEHHAIIAPVRVFEGQEELLAAFAANELDGDLVAVVRGQGPRANGMPELHKLTPALGVLLDRGHRVALLTDGRMSGASGKVPAAIHCTPEAAVGGPLSLLRDGDLVALDCDAGRLDAVGVDLAARGSAAAAPVGERQPFGVGRELFDAFRANIGPADAGASIFRPVPAPATVPGMSGLGAILAGDPVVPVVTVERGEDAVPLARAIAAGGLGTIEVTLRTPAALDAIRAIAAEVPEIAVGAGTVLDAAAIETALGAGAAFLVTPAATPELLDALAAAPVPVLPGVATPSEVAAALARGIETMKLFPAGAVGGTALLRALAGPFAEARFVPTGGIDAGSAGAYLALANVLAVGGSWVAARDPESPDWRAVTAAARAAAALGGAGS